MNLVEAVLGTQVEIDASKRKRELQAKQERQGYLSGRDKRAQINARLLANRRARRRTILGLTALLGLSVLGGGTLVVNNQRRPTYADDAELVRTFIASLNIQPSEKEQKLWGQAGFYPMTQTELDKQVQDVEGFVEELNKRIRVTTDWLMPQSQSPFFRDTSDFIRVHRDRVNDLSITPRLDDIDMGSKPMMGVSSLIEGNRVRWIISPTSLMIAANPALEIAIDLVHQSKHIKDYIDGYNSLPSNLPVQERRSQLIRQFHDTWVDKEARAYGEETDAFLYSYALTGISSPPRIAGAAAYLRCGADITQPCWKNYVSDNYISP